MKDLYNSLPTPACGSKEITGECYKCIFNQEDSIIRCDFIKALEEKNLYTGKCPICNGITLEEEITSSNPGAMTVCIEKGCDYRCNQFLDYEEFKRFDR